jgi:DNA-binding response OmpR family regulator
MQGLPMSYILMAEDERDILIMLRRKLEMSGYTNIRTTGDGQEALQMALAERPDLLILDVMLPGMDGLSICAEVKENYAENPPPVIVISARGQKIDIERAREAGADHYMVKPFSPRDLVIQIQEWIP